MLQIAFDSAAAHSTFGPDHELTDALAHLNLADKDTRHTQLIVVRDIADAASFGGHLWSLPGRPEAHVHIEAQFTASGDGDLVNNGCLTLSVWLGSGAGIADSGIIELRDLPHSEDTDLTGSVAAVLEAITARLNLMIAAAAKDLALLQP